MKEKERERAQNLRRKGYSVRSIAELVGCSRSSVSIWVREIPLTAQQIERLRHKQDQGRAKAANHRNSPKSVWAERRQRVIGTAQKQIPQKLNLKELRLVGTALYWAEGYKAGRNLFVFANCDPKMIKLMMKFLAVICKIPKEKLRGRVNIFPSLNRLEAERYWSKVSGIPLRQFHKPLLSVSRASKRKRKTLPLGTFRIVVSDVFLCSKIHGWIRGLQMLGE